VIRQSEHTIWRRPWPRTLRGKTGSLCLLLIQLELVQLRWNYSSVIERLFCTLCNKIFDTDAWLAVRVESEITDWFMIGKGVRQRQGCLISPLSFNFYSEQVMRESVDDWCHNQCPYNKQSTVRWWYSTHSNITRSIAEAGEQAEYCIAQVWAGDQYLESIITDTCGCRTEITARLGMARATATSKPLTSLWKDCSLNLQLKSRLMQTLIWSVATYGCESWTLDCAVFYVPTNTV